VLFNLRKFAKTSLAFVLVIFLTLLVTMMQQYNLFKTPLILAPRATYSRTSSVTPIFLLNQHQSQHFAKLKKFLQRGFRVHLQCVNFWEFKGTLEIALWNSCKKFYLDMAMTMYLESVASNLKSQNVGNYI